MYAWRSLKFSQVAQCLVVIAKAAKGDGKTGKAAATPGDSGTRSRTAKAEGAAVSKSPKPAF